MDDGGYDFQGGGTKFLGIGLLEVLWKAITYIMNLWLLSSITFHNVRPNFHAVRGTGIATVKVKLLQQLTSTRKAFLHLIFLGLLKAYDELDMHWCLGIRERYFVVSRVIRIL